MPSARILLQQSGRQFRFLLFEARIDGSLLVFLDRLARPWEGGMVLSDGLFVEADGPANTPVPYTRFSIHTTGTVHRYEGGNRKNTIYIEPLFALSERFLFGFISVPCLSKLDEWASHADQGTCFVIEFAPSDERITFGIFIGPRAHPPSPSTIAALDYELYSVQIDVVPLPVTVSSDMRSHFVCGSPPRGLFDHGRIHEFDAELTFLYTVHGKQLIIYREGDGSYVVFTPVPMRARPKLVLTFKSSELRIEQIDFTNRRVQPSHKARFWICDKGGRNKKDDLRAMIASISFDARL